MEQQGLSGIIKHADSRWIIVCDFDGTISCADVTDTLMEEFGHPDWKLLESRWEKGKIGSRDCLSGQISLLDATRQQLDACLDQIKIDQAFCDFARWAKAQSIPLYIVSDGLDYAIERILRNNNIAGLPVIANHLEQVGERRWHISFPHFNPDCRFASGTCKCRVAEKLNPHAFLVIGDGRSDFCVASRADHVLAKKGLLAQCRRAGIAHTPFESFAEARSCLEKQIAKAVRVSSQETL
ncbi:MtnX-like HAD-IB family phosphatase [Erwinia sp. SLM-02]|uniref:MtnX-like HAD-IB family phosphatase n=1 Tax=Erwinia sp. SLM-02 TaxID=3020057 RepID=UPI003080F7B4